MELKTIEIINNIARIDSEILPKVLLGFYESTYILYSTINDDAKWEGIMMELGLKNSDFFMKKLLEYLGFPHNDEIADEYITEYIDSNESNRMDILKKQLIEWAIETEELNQK